MHTRLFPLSMAPNPKYSLLHLHHHLLLLLPFTFFFLTLSSAHPQTQTLTITSLPHPHTLSWPEPESFQTDLESLEDSSLPMSLQLHHIDAFTSNKTPDQLFNLRLQRDALRAKSLTSMAAQSATHTRNTTRSGPGSGFSSSIISGLSQGSGEYFTRFGIGTPPRYFYMVLDTGSDVVWLQCSPCKKCYSQSDPIFNPRKSKSFSGIPCGSPLCHKLDSSGCNPKKKSCLYQVAYGDGSFTVGDFATETLTFRGTRVSRVAFGCGHDNQGLFVGAAGLLGLGRGRLSFPVQSGRRFNRKFSYCLVDRSSSSTSRPSSIMFGDSAISRTAVFTPLVRNPKFDAFYYVELVGISVGGAPVRGISASLFRLDRSGDGGVIIDSGTSVTRLTRPAYVAMRDAFRAGAKDLKAAPEFSLFDTCYDLSGKTTVKVPTVVFHFRGADVSLPAANYLIPVDSGGTFCLAFAGTAGGLSIIGNIQQQGFRVGFDLGGNRVGFSAHGCA